MKERSNVLQSPPETVPLPRVQILGLYSILGEKIPVDAEKSFTLDAITTAAWRMNMEELHDFANAIFDRIEKVARAKSVMHHVMSYRRECGTVTPHDIAGCALCGENCCGMV